MPKTFWSFRMTERYPQNLDGLVHSAASRFASEETEFRRHYQIRCSCGSELFTLLLSNKRSVLGVCSRCGTRVLIYDLALYPAATKRVMDEELFAEITRGANCAN